MFTIFDLENNYLDFFNDTGSFLKKETLSTEGSSLVLDILLDRAIVNVLMTKNWLCLNEPEI